MPRVESTKLWKGKKIDLTALKPIQVTKAYKKILREGNAAKQKFLDDTMTQILQFLFSVYIPQKI